MSNKCSKYIWIAVMPIVAYMHYNYSANWHYHLSDNQTVIRHAHPYQKVVNDHFPVKPHKHTTQQTFFLADVNVISEPTVPANFSTFIDQTFVFFSIPDYKKVVVELAFYYSHRGPPKCIFSAA